MHKAHKVLQEREELPESALREPKDFKDIQEHKDHQELEVRDQVDLDQPEPKDFKDIQEPKAQPEFKGQ